MSSLPPSAVGNFSSVSAHTDGEERQRSGFSRTPIRCDTHQFGVAHLFNAHDTVIQFGGLV
jgi:hypothetical protein